MARRSELGLRRTLTARTLAPYPLLAPHFLGSAPALEPGRAVNAPPRSAADLSEVVRSFARRLCI